MGNWGGKWFGFCTIVAQHCLRAVMNNHVWEFDIRKREGVCEPIINPKADANIRVEAYQLNSYLRIPTRCHHIPRWTQVLIHEVLYVLYEVGKPQSFVE